VWLRWLQTKHLDYKDICIDLNQTILFPENNILWLILWAIFEFKDIDMVDAEHWINISNTCVKSTTTLSKNIETTFESSRLENNDGIIITEKEMMSSDNSNLNVQKYLSYTHGSRLINKYNNPYSNLSNSFCFYDQFLQFLTYLEESISLPKKVWELEEVTLGSWSYLVEHQPPKTTAPHSMGSRKL
jgi:hypothetical protein